MNTNEYATVTMETYLELLNDEKSTTGKLYGELMSTLRGLQVEGTVTIVDLLANAFEELGYMEKASLDGDILSKEPSKDENDTTIITENKYTIYSEYFKVMDEHALDTDIFYNGSKQNHDWCSTFCDYVFVRTLGEKKMRLALARKKGRHHGAGVNYAASYYPADRQVYGGSECANVERGDQVFFEDKEGPFHTGIVVAKYDGYIYVIEGNTNPQIGEDEEVIPIGKGVCLKRYKADRTDMTFYRPRYELVLGNDPQELEGVDLDKKIAELFIESKKELETKLKEKGITPPPKEEKKEISKKEEIVGNIKDSLKVGAVLLTEPAKQMKNTIKQKRKALEEMFVVEKNKESEGNQK